MGLEVGILFTKISIVKNSFHLFVTALIVFTACKKNDVCSDVMLDLTRQEVEADNLRLDGFYYGNPFRTFEGESKYNLVVLYANGIVINPGAASEGQLESQIELISANINTISTSSKSTYGVFQIHGSEILLEKWRPGQCGHYVDFYEGHIVSDTVFTFNKLTTRTKNQVVSEEVAHTYVFHEYSTKPDSSNNYIE